MSEENNQKEDDFNEKTWLSKEGKLIVDVFKTDDHIIIQTAIAGISKEDLEIMTEKDVVVIEGERTRPTKENKIEEFYKQECYWGDFKREIVLPEETDPSRTEATMNQGILTIKVPRIEREEKREIELEDD